MSKISTETIETINQRADFISLVQEYTRLDRKGDDWWGCCPFHNEKTASFHVIPERKMYYCFGCGKGGGVISFLMEIEKLSFVEAVESLAKKNGIEVIYEGGNNYTPKPEDTTKDQLIELYDRVAGSFHYLLTKTDQGKETREYLAKRNVSLEIIEQFNLGYTPKDRFWLHSFLLKKGYSASFLEKSGLFSKKNLKSSFFSDRLMFPICNRKGQVVAFGGRLLSGEGPKYLNSGDLPQYKKGETLFAFHKALSEIRTKKSVILCEGYMDVLAWHQAGVTNAVAPLGTAFTEEQLGLVRTFADTVYLSFDSDLAGQQATYKAILLCRQKGFDVKIVKIQNGKDPADILLKEGPEALKKMLESSIMDLDYLVLIANSSYDIGTPEGKKRASAYIFPYIESLGSDIQKESTINRLSAALRISEKSLLSDYNSRKVQQASKSKEIQGSPITSFNIKQNAELRAVLAVTANINLFPLMRNHLSLDDFEDIIAKEIYIGLEDCYRNDTISFDNLLAKIDNDQICNLITETVINGEFKINADKVISDSINLIRKNTLEKQKNKILAKINLAQLEGSSKINDLNELLAEKKNIDEELFKLKDTQ